MTRMIPIASGEMLTASLPLFFFVFAGLFSPGPNVVMLTASAARFGFRATLPHLLGVPLGTGLLAGCSAFGLSALLVAFPALALFCKGAAAAWILWLAWRMVQAAQTGQQRDRGRPLRFYEAVLFQAINPKIWAVTLAASAGFGIGLPPSQEALRLFAAFAGINLFVCLFWTTVGHLLARFLRASAVWRVFMTIMSAVLASTAILIFV